MKISCRLDFCKCFDGKKERPPADGSQSSSRWARVVASLTKAALKVAEWARSAFLWSQVDLRVEGLRHGGVALLAGSFFRVQRHFGTLDDNVVDFILFPPTTKSTPDWDKRKVENVPCYAGPTDTDLVGSSSWSLVPVTSSGWMRTCSNIGLTESVTQKYKDISQHLVSKSVLKTLEGVSLLLLLPQRFPCFPSCCSANAGRTQSCTDTCRRDGGRASRRWHAGG